MPIFKQIATITADDQWTDSVKMIGDFNVSISGTWNNSIVTTQRQFDEDGTWLDVDTFEENTEIVGHEPEKGVLYRIGVKAGDFGGGSIEVRLSR